jgi:hypothetical protein
MTYSIFQTSVLLANVGGLTPALVVSIVSGALALALELIPGLAPRWQALPKEVKRFSWLVGCALVGILPWALGCLAAYAGADLTVLVIVGSCEPDTLAQGLQIAFAAYFSSQSVHGLSVGVRKLLNIAPYDQ